jgi:hypothetical protein
MIRTPVCHFLQMDHPIALGGMGAVYAPELPGSGGLRSDDELELG